MRLLSLARILFTLLAFQLAVGLQAGVASAAPAQVHADCPKHHTDGAQPAKPASLEHGCCKFSGCQGHCANLPLAPVVTPVRIVPDTSLVRALVTARSPSALPDTLFRPPIAS